MGSVIYKGTFSCKPSDMSSAELTALKKKDLALWKVVTEQKAKDKVIEPKIILEQ